MSRPVVLLFGALLWGTFAIVALAHIAFGNPLVPLPPRSSWRPASRCTTHGPESSRPRRARSKRETEARLRGHELGASRGTAAPERRSPSARTWPDRARPRRRGPTIGRPMSFRREPSLHHQIGQPGRSRHGGSTHGLHARTHRGARSATSTAPRRSTSTRPASSSSSTARWRPDFRVVQLVPKGSACAIAIGDRDRHDDARLAPRPASRGRATSRPPATSSPGAGRRSARSSTSVRPARPRAWTRSGAATRRSCRSRIRTATPGWSRRSSATGGSRSSRSTRPPRDRAGRDRVRRWGVRVRGPHRAIPARAPRPLLPDAGLVRRGRGRGPGDVPAGVAGARLVRRQRARPRLAVPHRDERLPRHPPAQLAPADLPAERRRGARG